MTTSEKVAYLKGLADGYGLDGSTKEGKLLSTILDILEDLALDQEDLSDDIAELEEGLDAVSEDLEDVEEILFGDIEDDDLYDDDDEEIEDWDGETVTFDEGVLNQGGIACPVCGADLEFDLDEDEETEE